MGNNNKKTRDGLEEGRNLGIIFIHSQLDDLELSIYEFRIYAHLARRAGTGKAFPAYGSMAKKCRMSRTKAIDAVNQLVKRRMIQKQKRMGEDGRNSSNLYTLTDPVEWTLPNKDGSNEQVDGSPGEPPLVHDMNPPSSPGEPKGNPIEVDPVEESDLFSDTPQTDLPIPERMDGFNKQFIDDPEFCETWKDYCKVRREKRSTITATGSKRLKNKLNRYPLVVSKSALMKAADNGWTGVFPESIQGNENNTGGESSEGTKKRIGF